MQNRYSGDVGDYGKFGLLRHLLNRSNLRLGINWYLFPNEEHNEDGRFTNYLSSKKYSSCDYELHEILNNVVLNERSVRELEKAKIFNCHTRYFSEIVDFYPDFPGNTKAHKNIRLSLRKKWVEKAKHALSESDVIFLDPDNGLQVDSCESLTKKRAGKYAYFNEIAEFHDGKEFTVVYHHLNRHKKHGDHKKQIHDRALELKSKINPSHKVFGLRYRPYSPRAFFIITPPDNMGYVNQRLEHFMENNWSQYWDNLCSY